MYLCAAQGRRNIENASKSPYYLEFVLAAIRNQGALTTLKEVRAMNAVLPYLARLPSAVERSITSFNLPADSE